MLCDKCNQRESIIRISIVTDGEQVSLTLCNECLKQLVFNSSLVENVSSVYIKVIVNLLSDYLSDLFSDEDFELKVDKDKNRETEQYRPEDSIDDLQNKLDIAVIEENYEYAAILRDRIIELKKGDDKK